MKVITLSVSILFFLIKVINATKFDVVGPVVTLTLKDPSGSTSTSNNIDKSLDVEQPVILDGLFSIPGLNPCVTWSIASSASASALPFPKLLPSLKSISLSTQYKYHENKKFFNKIEGLLRFVTSSRSRRGNKHNSYNDDDEQHNNIDDVPAPSEIILKPSYSFKSKKACLNIKCGNEGSVFGMIKLSACGNKGKRLIEYIKGSYRTSLPFINSISHLTFQPSFDFIKGMPSCIISGVTNTGSLIGMGPNTGKTTAIIDLNFDEPTLSFIHHLDEWNIISPIISLNTAKIVYNWKLLLKNDSTIVTRLDPSNSMHVCWTDCAPNGHWITDFTLPLSSNPTATGIHIDHLVTASKKGPLVADIRVRRQFIF